MQYWPLPQAFSPGGYVEANITDSPIVCRLLETASIPIGSALSPLYTTLAVLDPGAFEWTELVCNKQLC